MSLYREVLGASWDDLGEGLRRLHAGGRVVVAEGAGRIEVGETAALRLLGRLLGFPPAAEAAPIRLEIVPAPGGERWVRHFAGVRVESWEESCKRRAGDLLAETFRGVELRFRLRVEGAGLRFEQVAAGLRAGPVRIPLPARLAPRVEAHDVAVGSGEIRFAVRISLFGRRLLGYAGAVTVREEVAG